MSPSSPGWFRDAFSRFWNLLFFGAAAIALALTLNLRNSAWGYWINLGIISLADTGFILFVLLPGYVPIWPGILGPFFWVAGWAFTTHAYMCAPPLPLCRSRAYDPVQYDPARHRVSPVTVMS